MDDPFLVFYSEDGHYFSLSRFNTATGRRTVNKKGKNANSVSQTDLPLRNGGISQMNRHLTDVNEDELVDVVGRAFPQQLAERRLK